MCALKKLNPSFVCDGGEEVAAVSLDIHMQNKSVCVTSAYGPLENAPLLKKTSFGNIYHNKHRELKVLERDLFCKETLMPGLAQDYSQETLES